MPEFIITQTAKEFSDYQKKKAKERVANALWGILVFVIGMGTICHLAGFFR